MGVEEEKIFSPQRSKRFLKWFLIGTIGWGLNNLLLYLLNDLILEQTAAKDLNVKFWFLTINKGVIASLISMFIVIVFTFSMNKIWTFKGEEFHSNTLIQFFQFGIIGILGFAIYSGLMMGLHGTLEWNEYLSMVIAYYAGLINNFVWNELWTFNPRIISWMKTRKRNSTRIEVSENNLDI